MNDTAVPQGDSSAPQWLKTAVTLVYRVLCGLLILAGIAFVAMQLFRLPIERQPIRLPQFFAQGFGVMAISVAWRIWLLRLPVPHRFSAPVPYGYPGWRPILQAQLVCGCVLVAFGVALFFL